MTVKKGETPGCGNENVSRYIFRRFIGSKSPYINYHKSQNNKKSMKQNVKESITQTVFYQPETNLAVGQVVHCMLQVILSCYKM
jgi:hypothetical protein